MVEISATWKSLTIPILEPLSASRITKVSKIVMGCMLASVSVATTQSILSLGTNLNSSGASTAFEKNGEDVDASATEIIEKSLELFNAVVSLLRESTRAGGHVLQNFMTMGAWVLTTGLMVQLNNTSQVLKQSNLGSKIGLAKEWMLLFRYPIEKTPRAAAARHPPNLEAGEST